MAASTIEMEGVGKRYRLGEDFSHYRYRTLRDSLGIGRRDRSEGVRREEIWALRDVSLSVREGEVLGVIGRNGAGKTTLLKMLARITAPTAGIVRTRGRPGSLLEVGTGFHPELTGRENVFLNGAILGMSRQGIARRLGQIIEFADVAAFIDTPLKRYSTGMSLRLAFAVAAHVEPPILAIDEILAVGDAEFRRKCLATMSDLGDAGRTVVFVSHDLGAIAQLCRRTVWLEGGRVAADGPTEEVVEAYLRSGMTQSLKAEFEADDRGPVSVLGVEVADDQGRRLDMPRRDRPFGIRVKFEVRRPLSRLDLSVSLVNRRGVTVLDESFSDTGNLCIAGEPGEHGASLLVPPTLASDDYTLGIWMGAFDTYAELEPFSFRLWPRPDDPADWTARVRVAQPAVHWNVERMLPQEDAADPTVTPSPP